MRHFFTLFFTLSSVMLTTDGLQKQLEEIISQSESIVVVVRKVELAELD